jgi:hypothetical protein
LKNAVCPFPRLCLALLACLSILLPCAAFAQATPLITQQVDPAQRKIFSNTVHPLVKKATDLGRADASLPMNDMLLMLQPSPATQKVLAQYIQQLHNPNSPYFHKWLTPERYAAKFGNSRTDIATVSQWLTSNGFTVEQVARGTNWIRFSGTSSQVENAFQTEVHKYLLNGQTRYSNATNISIPTALTPVVSGVVSMNNFTSHALHTAPQKMVRNTKGQMVPVANTSIKTTQGTAAPSPEFTAGGAGQATNYIAPGDFSAIYDVQPTIASGINGSGVSIAIVGRSDISISDIEAFRTISGLPFNDPNVIYASTDPGVVSGDNVEASLDIEWAGAVAPRATINYVIGASTNTTDGVDISSSYIVDNVTAPIMTVSFGLCEQLEPDSEIAFIQMLWQQAAAEGITVLVAAGDSGSSSCNEPTGDDTIYGFGVSATASTPYDTAVGGTEFIGDLTSQSTYWNTTNAGNQASAKGYIPEAVWNESCQSTTSPALSNCAFPPYDLYSYAGGGGASSCITRTTDEFGDEYCAGGYPKPTWQTGTGVPQDGSRDLPDVSLDAAEEHDPFLFCYEGDCQWTTGTDGTVTLLQADLVGGTSVASPSMAGVMALVEQKAGMFQGVANYQLYSLAAAQSSSSCNSSNRTDPTQAAACVFNDITQGSNAIPCLGVGQDCGDYTDQPVLVGEEPPPFQARPGDQDNNGFSATAGYDQGSGLGSVDVTKLVNAWGSLKLNPTTTTLTLSQTSFQHGTPITVSGSVTPAPGSGTPTGSVVITATNTNGAVQTFPLTTGAFSGSTINLPGGTYTITASYSGDSAYGISTSAPVSVNVTSENSTVTGTSWAYLPLHFGGGDTFSQVNAALLGYPWYLQFNVAGASGTSAAITGTIKLSQGSRVVGTFPVDSKGEIYVSCGQNAGNGCDFPIGTYTFTAQYSGDSSYKASTGTYQFQVQQGRPFWSTQTNNTNTQSVANSTVVAQAFFPALSAWDPAIPPTGVMTFTRSDTGATLGSAKLDNAGTATISFNAGTGTYQLLASWAGDANYSNQVGMNGTASIQTASNAGTLPVSVALNLGGGSFSLGQRTQYTVSVTPQQKSGAMPIGYIQLYTVAGPLGAQLALAGGKAIGTMEWDNVGTQPVYATYEGDNNFGGASSPATTVTVAQATPALTVQPASTYAGVGTIASVTAVLSNPLGSTSASAPTGTIQFFGSLNGAAAQAIGKPQTVTTSNGALLATLASALPQGSNIITATYSGDSNWKSVSSAATSPIVVTSPDFAVTATPNPLTVTAGESASLQVATQSILGYSSPVALSCSGTLPPGISCNSASVNPGASGAITISSVAPGTSTTSSAAAKTASSLWKLSGTAAFAALFFACIPNRKRFAHLAILLMVIAASSGLVGCGGSGGTTPLPTSVSLTSSSTKVASGTSVAFQASITSASNTTTTGTVTFYDGTTTLGSPASLENGVATLNTSSLSVGTHAITAKYSGDKNNVGSSSSDVLNQTITGQFSLVIIASSGSISHPITIPATLQ